MTDVGIPYFPWNEKTIRVVIDDGTTWVEAMPYEAINCPLCDKWCYVGPNDSNTVRNMHWIRIHPGRR